MYKRFILNVSFESVPDEASKGSYFHRFSGFAIRTFLYRDVLKMVYGVDLHKVGGLRPFSVTPIYTRMGGVNIFGYRSRVSSGVFQVRLLNIVDPIFIINKLSFLNKEAMLDIKNYRISISNISVLSYYELVKSSKPINEFMINFLTPTSVRSPSTYISLIKVGGIYKPRIKLKTRKKGIYIPLPYPNLIFKNLLRMFRKFSGLDDVPYDDIREYIENDNIIITKFPDGIRSRAIKLSEDEKYIGFIGKVYYSLDGPKDMRRYIHMLLKYAEYSNIGVGRTAGLGWVETKVIK